MEQRLIYFGKFEDGPDRTKEQPKKFVDRNPWVSEILKFQNKLKNKEADEKRPGRANEITKKALSGANKSREMIANNMQDVAASVGAPFPGSPAEIVSFARDQRGGGPA